jgi:predicted ATP-dependent endonuclease of OLD family
MIKKLKVKNFKSLSDVNLEMRNLTLLTGLNGSGKSTVFQILKLLSDNIPFLDDKNTAVYTDPFDSGFVLATYSKINDLSKTIQIGLETENRNFKWNLTYDQDEYGCPLKNSLLLYTTDRYTLDELKQCALFTSRTKHVNLEKYMAIKDCSFFQEERMEFLNSFTVDSALKHPCSESLLITDQLGVWLSDITKGSVKIIGTSFTKNDNNMYVRYEPKHIGLGLTYIIDVLIRLLMAKQGDLLLIENPEVFLHPHGQVVLGKLISMVAQNGTQLIIETHSDHLVNGIRIACHEDILDKDNVVFLYFKRDVKCDYKCSYVVPIFINDDVRLYSLEFDGVKFDTEKRTATIPKGFSDTWLDSMSTLLFNRKKRRNNS